MAYTEQTAMDSISTSTILNIISYRPNTDGATLHVSKETLDDFPEILSKVPEWLGRSMDLSILHADDIERASIAAGIPLNELPHRAAELADKLGEYFPNTPISRISNSDILPPDQTALKKTLMQGAYQDYPVGIKFSVKDNSTKEFQENNGILAIPRGDQTVIDYFSRQTKIPVSELKNISGSANDLNYARMGHEVAHFNDGLIYVPPSIAIDEDARILKDEIFSDQGQNYIYFKEIENGTPLDKTVPESIKGALALRGFLTETFTHATSQDFCLPNDQCPQIYKELGNGEARYERALDLKQGLSDAREKVYARIQHDTNITIDEAKDFSRDQPELFYETIKILEHEGVFKESDIQQTYVNQFLQAAGQYAPEHFGVNLPGNGEENTFENKISGDTVPTIQSDIREPVSSTPPPSL